MDDQHRSSEETEVLQTGSGGPRRPVRIAIIVVACCAVLAGIAVWRARHDDRAEPGPSHPSTPQRSGTSPGPPPSQRHVRSADLSWLHLGTGYSVFLRTADSVHRTAATGDRVVQTSVPRIASSGPVAFWALSDGAIIQPEDRVPNYQIPDNGVARRTGTRAGVLLPGPQSGQMWVESGQSRLKVTRPKTTATQGAEEDAASDPTTMRIPDRAAGGVLLPDGHGYVVTVSTNGVYDIRPHHLTRLTDSDTAAVVAANSKRMILGTGDCSAQCPATVLGKDLKPLSHQPRHRLRVSAEDGGAISPDGHSAALVLGDSARLVLYDLTTGKPTPTGVRGRRTVQPGDGTVAFSSDGRWVFIAGADRRAHAVDTRSGKARTLLPQVRGVQQVAVRR